MFPYFKKKSILFIINSIKDNYYHNCSILKHRCEIDAKQNSGSRNELVRGADTLIK